MMGKDDVDRPADEERGGPRPGRMDGHIDPKIQTEIGKHLRAIYDDVVNEPVPSRFMELLEKLEHSTSRKR